MTLRWYACGLVLAAAVGYLAARCHLSGWAPVGIVSLAVGLCLGLSVVKLAGWFDVNCRKQLLSGALVFALVTIFAEHAWLYRDFCRQWREVRDANPQVAIFRPETPWSPAEYLRHEATGSRVALWCVDAALIFAGTVSVVIWRAPNRGDEDTSKLVVADDANQPRPLTSDP